MIQAQQWRVYTFQLYIRRKASRHVPFQGINDCSRSIITQFSFMADFRIRISVAFFRSCRFSCRFSLRNCRISSRPKDFSFAVIAQNFTVKHFVHHLYENVQIYTFFGPNRPHTKPPWCATRLVSRRIHDAMAKIYYNSKGKRVHSWKRAKRKNQKKLFAN